MIRGHLTHKVLRSSFFWFLAIGALIFAVDARLNRAGDDIIVSDRALARISALWRQQMNREPTALELRNLAENWVNEEMLFREAKRLGFDEEDVIVRRRLVQKMQFIAEQGEVLEPDEATLRAWFETNRQQYELPVRFTFSHVFFRAEPTAEQTAQVNAGSGNAWRTQGDPTMQRPTYVQQSERQIASEFGARFAGGITRLAPSETWQGPVASEFGWHLVRLDAVEEKTIPAFETARNQVRNDYLFEAREKARRGQLDALRERYDVIWEGGVEAGVNAN